MNISIDITLEEMYKDEDEAGKRLYISHSTTTKNEIELVISPGYRKDVSTSAIRINLLEMKQAIDHILEQQEISQ